jgi:hypothetical protein
MPMQARIWGGNIGLDNKVFLQTSLLNWVGGISPNLVYETEMSKNAHDFHMHF